MTLTLGLLIQSSSLDFEEAETRTLDSKMSQLWIPDVTSMLQLHSLESFLGLRPTALFISRHKTEFHTVAKNISHLL